MPPYVKSVTAIYTPPTPSGDAAAYTWHSSIPPQLLPPMATQGMLHAIDLTLVGGGGGGCQSTSSTPGLGGEAGSVVQMSLAPVIPASQYSLKVGLGGKAGPAPRSALGAWWVGSDEHTAQPGQPSLFAPNIKATPGTPGFTGQTGEPGFIVGTNHQETVERIVDIYPGPSNDPTSINKLDQYAFGAGGDGEQGSTPATDGNHGAVIIKYEIPTPTISINWSPEAPIAGPTFWADVSISARNGSIVDATIYWGDFMGSGFGQLEDATISNAPKKWVATSHQYDCPGIYAPTIVLNSPHCSLLYELPPSRSSVRQPAGSAPSSPLLADNASNCEKMSGALGECIRELEMG
ncbi:MAG: hypothetical protein METHP_01487 [Methanoregula sp. SKADARSKE-2]|nr:MAG: hypothetical protein METHP_01487 [Methanoregula sp. SKADARSKE-2]